MRIKTGREWGPNQPTRVEGQAVQWKGGLQLLLHGQFHSSSISFVASQDDWRQPNVGELRDIEQPKGKD
jgi:hypothetical protein